MLQKPTVLHRLNGRA